MFLIHSLQAFAHFPTYDFVWKFTSHGNYSHLFSSAPNVHPVDWVDQRALLAHPRLHAFITHCGMNSLNEAAQSGVPVVGIPLFGDQLFNAALMQHKGIGVYLDVRKLEDEQWLIGALERVLNDKRYDLGDPISILSTIFSFSARSKLLQRKLQSTPFPPAERLVRWVEFAAQFPDGLEELNLPGEQQLGWLAYYSLDVIGATMGALILMGLLSRWLMRLALAKMMITVEGMEKKVQ